MASRLVLVQKGFLKTMLSDFNKLRAFTIEDQSETELEAYLQILEADYKDCRKYHAQIQQADDEEENVVIQSYETDDIMKQIRSTYRHFWTLLNERIQYKRKTKMISSHAESNKTAVFNSDIKLPRVELPVFNGKYEDWIPFYNLFTATVHNNSNLEPVQKLHYLLKAVTGEAHKHIRNLTLTDENYQTAIDLLIDQYDHQRKTANVYMRTLLDYPTIKSESSRDFKDLLATIKDCSASLEQLKLPVKQWDYILLCIMQQKIPMKTYREWEKRLGASRDIPKFEDFKIFLEETFRTLEMIEPSAKNDQPYKEKEDRRTKTFHLQTENKKNVKITQKTNNKGHKKNCPLCKGNHGSARCSKLLNANVQARWKIVEEKKLCSNCLGINHSPESCYSFKSCIFCKPQVVRHHSLLHEQVQSNQAHSQMSNPPGPSGQAQSQTGSQPIGRNFHLSCHTDRTKLLGTAQAQIVNHQGFSINVRILVDPCSEDNYMSASTAQLLQLVKHKEPSSVSVLGDEVTTECPYRVNFKIKSLKSEFETTTSAAIVRKITSELPSEYIPSSDCGFLNYLPLSDPNYNQPGEIHLLLGSCFDAEIIRPGLKKFGTHVYAQNTELGWIIRGRTSAVKANPSNLVLLTKKTDETVLTEQIKKFWELEEIPGESPEHPDDVRCEELFLSSIEQKEDGHLSIDLPFRHDEQPVMGPSREIALKRFLNLEKKLSTNEELKTEYHRTMQEYIQSGHMKVADQRNAEGREYFLPHHAVFKESSTTTKVRVVFDASCRTEDGTSLNDRLLTGPKLQTDIRDILFNWRKFRFALTADIAKMYRMFYVNEKHHSYQKILWRFNETDPITDYSLCTVTFGTSSAPYLAIRMLHYIAEINQSKAEFSLAVEALKSEFYVDDFISGAHSLTDAINKNKQLRDLLGRYGLDIRKWSSNDPKIMESIPTNLHETSTQFSLDETEFRKTLGIYWSPRDDFFKFSIDRENSNLTELTKRKALSLIARIYDPMGWLSPCTLYAKILMQEIWKTGTNWDDEVCENIKPKFLKFLHQLKELEKIKIPRWVNLRDEESPVKLIGFCDASTKGYGAVIYLQDSLTENELTDWCESKLILLGSKTKVAPMNVTSIPRLELCAALLLSELLTWARKLLHPRKVDVVAFSDSQVVLSWLKADPSRWKVYVATRTAKIRESVPPENWFYVHTTNNPADFASKGLLPSEMINNDLWWNGPELETVSEENTLTEEEQEYITKETKILNVSFCTTQEINPFLTDYSSHFKVCQIVRRCCDFFKTCLKRLMNKQPTNKDRYLFLVQRMDNPELILFRLVQRASFSDEINDLKNNRYVKPASRIKTLNPFIDGFEILRVGGRLENSTLTYNQKHPIILPTSHQITSNLIENAHKTTMHGMTALTMSYLRNKFHILRASDAVKKIVNRCVTCLRYTQQQHTQLMGSLPSDRVSINRPFLNTGVDYAGPIVTREKRRNSSTTKSYIALFVCLSTKALHLEIVSDLTSQAFLAAYRRFVNRRGHCQRMYSDRGTNFVGAQKILKEEVYKAEKTWRTELTSDFHIMGTEWLFNPAAAPHFGGLWEAGVKSVKTHLVKSVGNKALTFEELTTIVVQIEGILNSRPLCPLKNDPNDFVALTPGHFLIGEPIIAPPEPVLNNEPKNLLDRWKHLQTVRQSFWRSYLKDYLNRLQRRPKWLKQKYEYKIGDIVLVIDETCPPTIWPKALIVNVHPGSDGHIRIVTLRNSQGKIFKRAVAKIRVLPVYEIPNNEQSFFVEQS